MRDLPQLMRDTGWTLKGTKGTCVSEVGSDPSYWVSFAKAYLPRVKAAGIFADADVVRWWELQQEAIDEGRFFAHCVYYTFTAVATE
jgi:hypothetical protein